MSDHENILRSYGEIALEDDSWVIESATISKFGDDIYVSVSDDNGTPNSSAVKRLELINNKWRDTFKILEETAYEAFYEPYADAVSSTPNFTSSSELLGTEQIEALFIKSNENFEITLRFEWQEELDYHSVTFYVENGVCVSLSVDG